jgi:hypothetical protein
MLQRLISPSALPARPATTQASLAVFSSTAGESATGTVTAVLPDGFMVVRVRWTASSGYGQAVAWHLRQPR